MHRSIFTSRRAVQVIAAKRPISVIAAASVAAIALVAALAGATAAADGAPVTAGVPSCQTGGLVVWLDTQSNGAAGSTFYNLEFTNLSGHTCTLRGYPGVSAIGLRGHKIGNAATRNTAHRTKTITLKNVGTAITVLRIVEAGNFSPSVCGPVTAAGLRVYPPNQSASKTVPFPFPACSKTGILSVEAVQTG